MIIKMKKIQPFHSHQHPHPHPHPHPHQHQHQHQHQHHQQQQQQQQQHKDKDNKHRRRRTTNGVDATNSIKKKNMRQMVQRSIFWIIIRTILILLYPHSQQYGNN